MHNPQIVLQCIYNSVLYPYVICNLIYYEILQYSMYIYRELLYSTITSTKNVYCMLRIVSGILYFCIVFIVCNL